MGRDFDLERWPLDEERPEKARSLKRRRMRDQHIGIFATRIAVLASRIYQNSHIGEKGCANE